MVLLKNKVRIFIAERLDGIQFTILPWKYSMPMGTLYTVDRQWQ